MGRTEANYPLKQFRSESRVGIGSFLLVEFTDVVCAGADLALERERDARCRSSWNLLHQLVVTRLAVYIAYILGDIA
jgi:hypothetical protein